MVKASSCILVHAGDSPSHRRLPVLPDAESRRSDAPRATSQVRQLRTADPPRPADRRLRRTFDRVTADTTVPVVVDFYADWCGPCKMMAPLLDDVAHQRAGQVLVLKLDTDENPATQ